MRSKSTARAEMRLTALVLGLLALEPGVMYAFQINTWIFMAGFALMLAAVLVNHYRIFPSGLAFFICVGWMVVAIIHWPQPSGLRRIWTFDDFSGLVLALINFLIGAWLYIYNRRRW